MEPKHDEQILASAVNLRATRGEEFARMSPPSAQPVATGGLPWARLRRVADHIDGNLAGDLRLAELSRFVHMSPYHFARLFKQTAGMSPHRFVVRCRIDRAIELLEGQEHSIAEIARLVGFATPSHFTTVFRHIIGLTPTEYRARYRGEARPDPDGGRDEAA